MDSPHNTMPLSATTPPPGPDGLEKVDSDEPEAFLARTRTDRLYQIAAVTAGLILLATAF